MRWYQERLKELEIAEPVYSVCGDDCAVCPRHLAETDEQLRETAEFWHRVGWRDHVVSNDEIRCTGCGSRLQCSFMLLSCVQERGVKRCSECSDFPCDRVRDALAASDRKKEQCRRACGSEAEFAMLVRAFYEKEKHL